MDMKSSYNLSELIDKSLLDEYNSILNDTEEFNKLFCEDKVDQENSYIHCDPVKSIIKKEEIIPVSTENTNLDETKDHIISVITPPEIGINSIEAREALKKKLEDKRNSIKNNRKPLVTKEDNQINMLKNNPLFKNIENLDKDSIKKIIDTVASNMTSDSKQKKNIKKQVEKLIEKMTEKKN